MLSQLVVDTEIKYGKMQNSIANYGYRIKVIILNNINKIMVIETRR